MHLSSVTSPFSPALLCFLRLPVGLYGILREPIALFHLLAGGYVKKAMYCYIAKGL